MAYIPLNLNIYTAAFSGAMAGIGIPSGAFIVDPVSGHYVLVANVATAFARALDTAWGAVGANEYNVQAVCEASCNTFVKGSGLPADGTITTQANWTIVATAIVAMIRQGDVAATTDGIVFPPVDGGVIPHQFWVATWGSDTVGNGTSTHPYRTIAYTQTKITDASLLAIYDVILYPGNFDENVVLKPFVNIRGVSPTIGDTGTYACTIVGNVTLGAGFAGVSNNPGWLTNVTITGTVILSFAGVGSDDGEITFNNCQLRDDVTFTMNETNFVDLQNVVFSADCTQLGGSVTWRGVSNINGGALAVKARIGQGAILNAFNSSWKGIVGFDQNAIDTVGDIVTVSLVNTDMSSTTMTLTAAGDNAPVVGGTYGATPENVLLVNNAILSRNMRVNVPFGISTGTTIQPGINDIIFYFGSAPNAVFGKTNIEYMTCALTMAGNQWNTDMVFRDTVWYFYVRQNGPAQELHLVIYSHNEAAFDTTGTLNFRFNAFYDYTGGP